MLEVDKLLNVSLSVFRDLRNNSLDIKTFPVDIFTGLKNLKEMWVSLKSSVSFAWKLGVALYYLRCSTQIFHGLFWSGFEIRCYYYWMRSSRKYLFLPLPLPRVETTEIPRGGEGPRGGNFRGGGGGFPGALSKIDELFKTNSCPVEEVISHFPVNSLLKQ